MTVGSVTQEQFEAIHASIKDAGITLLITDFNGVLDDYYTKKYAFLSAVLGDRNRSHLPALAVFTDTEYILDRTATLERSIRRYYQRHGLSYGAHIDHVIDQGMGHSHITPEAKHFLDGLSVPYVIYTSQTADAMRVSLDGHKADVYSRDRTGAEKPSVLSLQKILTEYGETAENVCVLGDGLIDDLMPARLLGMKTILATPFADTLHTIR